jgi:hypothetical protein
MQERVTRAMMAKKYTASVVAGSTRFSMPSRPPVGSQRSHTENTAMPMMPR